MKILRLAGLFAGLIVAVTGTVDVRGQATIDEAIKQVKAITDPDPVRQNELRAEETKNIIMGRIRTTNPNGLLAENAELEKLDAVIEKMRGGNTGGEEMINWTWDNRAGRCDEQIRLMEKILSATGVNVTKVTSSKNHIFLLVNLAPDADLDNPWTWGPNAFSPDTWVGRTLRAEDSWREKFHFDEGRGFVGHEREGGTTRQYLKRSEGLQNQNAIKPDCTIELNVGKHRVLNYRKMLNDFFKIPEEYRKGFEFKPKAQIQLEEGMEELEGFKKQVRRIDQNDGDEIRKIHAGLSDLDGRYGSLNRCHDFAAFRKKINETMKLLPKMKTDATTGIADVEPTDEVPDDIKTGTGQVKVIQYFVFVLTNSSNGLYVGSEDSLKGTLRCGYVGGGIGCKPSDVITYKRLAGPFATQAEARDALCQGITESRIFPIGIGLKGKWQGGTWYGLWESSVTGCSR